MQAPPDRVQLASALGARPHARQALPDRDQPLTELGDEARARGRELFE
jgi:hypothetical protein